jgi:hypothetical protein
MSRRPSLPSVRRAVYSAGPMEVRKTCFFVRKIVATG